MPASPDSVVDAFPRGPGTLPSSNGVSTREQRVLILTAISSDALLTRNFLVQAGMAAETCRDIPDLCSRVREGCGAILLAQEALEDESVEELARTLSEQPSWSDIPITVILVAGDLGPSRLRRMTALGPTGNVTLLERPLRTGTLVSTLEAALRARRRQYEVRQLLVERQRSEEALRESERRMAEDLAGITVLHQLASRFVAKGNVNIHPVFNDVVDTAISLTHADKGTLQLYNPQTGILELAAHRGFPSEWVEHFKAVNSTGSADAACGMAMNTGRRIVVEDVNTSPIFVGKPSLAFQQKAGVRAVQSTPLFSRSGELLGMLSTHFGVPHRPSERELERLDLLARQAADLLERAESERALRHNEERFRLLVSILTDVPWVSNPAGEFVDRQLSWEEYTGQKLAEYEGMGWLDAVHPDDQPRVSETWLRSLSAKTVFESRHRMWSARSREWRHVAARACPLANNDGSVREWVGTCTDIHDMVMAREALEKNRRELEQLVADRTAKLKETVGELEAFSYSIAHDMRAPLRAMAGFGTILREDYGPQLDATAQTYLERISNAAARLDRLIQDVLDYSRVVRNKPELEVVDTGTLLEEIIQTYPNMQPPKTRIDLIPPLPRVIANPAGLTQVFSNILGNAVKFVAPGTAPQIRVSAENIPQSFHPGPGSSFVKLWFEDNGIGMDPEGAKRVFQMFQRLVDSNTYEGTGIGLAIVKKSVERMGGEVGVESEPGRGSRFWVRLKKA
jgi:PAS domain S-box-containing protein